MKWISINSTSILFIHILTLFTLSAENVDIKGLVTDHKGTPVSDVTITLQENSMISTKTDSEGKYTLAGSLPIGNPNNQNQISNFFILNGNKISFNCIKDKQLVTILLYNAKGSLCNVVVNTNLSRGNYTFALFDKILPSSIYFLHIDRDGQKGIKKLMYVKGQYSTNMKSFSLIPHQNTNSYNARGHLSLNGIDILVVSKTGFENRTRSIDSYSGTQDFIIVPQTLSFSSNTVPLSSQTNLSASHTYVNRYGLRPQISVIGNSDNSCDVALYVSSTNKIQVLSFDSAGTKTGEITPSYISGAEALLGLTKITDDGSFVVGYAKDNSFGDNAFEFWITRFNTQGSEIFTKSIFGNKSADVVESEGEPGRAGSGRIVFNPTTKKIAFYCAHSRLWDDNVRHQGGHIAFMDLQGEFYTANSWFFSHNFDQRLIVVDSFYYALAHGDAYPRALGFSKWNDVPPRGKRLVNEKYWSISGSIGDNTTNCQTGGLIKLDNGTFGVVFTTKIDRGNWDVCYMNINSKGENQDTTWLTSYSESTFAIFPKIASYGKCVLIAWEEVTNKIPKVKTLIVNNTGEILSSKRELKDAKLSPFYDLVTVHSGDILWATLENSSNLKLLRIRK